jgi:hypothetical protein
MMKTAAVGLGSGMPRAILVQTGRVRNRRTQKVAQTAGQPEDAAGLSAEGKSRARFPLLRTGGGGHRRLVRQRLELS